MRSAARRLNLRDLVLAQILCVVGSSWVGLAAGLGHAQTFVWLLAFGTFFIPMASNASNILYGIAYMAMFAIPLIGAVMVRRRLPIWRRRAAESRGPPLLDKSSLE